MSIPPPPAFPLIPSTHKLTKTTKSPLQTKLSDALNYTKSPCRNPSTSSSPTKNHPEKPKSHAENLFIIAKNSNWGSRVAQYVLTQSMIPTVHAPQYIPETKKEKRCRGTNVDNNKLLEKVIKCGGYAEYYGIEKQYDQPQDQEHSVNIKKFKKKGVKRSSVILDSSIYQ